MQVTLYFSIGGFPDKDISIITEGKNGNQPDAQRSFYLLHFDSIVLEKIQ